jgi:hypothetical protein
MGGLGWILRFYINVCGPWTIRIFPEILGTGILYSIQKDGDGLDKGVEPEDAFEKIPI